MSRRPLSELNVKFLKGCVRLTIVLFVLELIGSAMLVAAYPTAATITYCISSLVVVFILLEIISNIAVMAEQIEVIKHDIIEDKLGVSLAEFSDIDEQRVPETEQDINVWLEEDVDDSQSVEFEFEVEDEEDEDEQDKDDDKLVTPDTVEAITEWLNGDE